MESANNWYPYFQEIKEQSGGSVHAGVGKPDKARRSTVEW